MNNIVFLISGKPHHYKVINNVKQHHTISCILTKIDDLKKLNNAIVFVIGSNIISKDILNTARDNDVLILNLHSGDTRKYRGIDCEYWSLLYDNNIICTLHEIDENIDTGPIYLQCEVNLDGLHDINNLKMRIADAYSFLINKFLDDPIQYIKNKNDRGNGVYCKPISTTLLNIVNKKLKKRVQ